MPTPINYSTPVQRRPALPVNAIGAMIVIAIIVGCRLANPLHTGFASVETNHWAGFSESALVQKFGQPTSVTAEYTVIGLHVPATLPAMPIKTCMYRRQGGYLYLWYQSTGGKWMCFESLWFDKDVQF